MFAFSMLYNALAPDVLNKSVPGNIRRAEHFIHFMKKVVEHYLKTHSATVSGGSYSTGGVQSETPLAFLHRMTNGTSLEAEPIGTLFLLSTVLLVSNSTDFQFGRLSFFDGCCRFCGSLYRCHRLIPSAGDPIYTRLFTRLPASTHYDACTLQFCEPDRGDERG
jgi:hypothetical protein